jgi:predicted enzyme related to lactoylglutathione lyase
VIQGLDYVVVTTGDVPRARRFFTEQLGLGTEDDMGDVFSQFTTREGTLWAIAQAAPDADPANVKLYLRVDDLDAAYRTWKERGVETITEPHAEPFGRTFAFRDPDGHTLHAWSPA